MTTKEKAQAYDEALKRARIWQNHLYDTNDKDYAEELNYIFPELKESEDERIRKALINGFKDYNGWDKEWFDGITIREAIAWLEKQGKTFTMKDIDDAYLRGVSDAKHELEKQDEKEPYDQRKECLDCQFNYAGECKGSCQMKRGEQKPVYKVEPKFKIKYAGSEYNVLDVKDIAGVTYYVIEDEPNHIDYVQAENCERVDGYSIKESGSPFPTKPAKFSEQKPAWSEEDNMMIEETLYFLREYQQSNRCKDENGMQNSVSCEKWLKSLKERLS